MERNVTSPNRTASRKWSALLSIACFSENARSSRDGPLAGSPMSRSAPCCPPWKTRCRAYGAKFPHRGRGPLSAILYGIRSVRGLGWHHLVCYISKGNRNSRCKKKPHPSPNTNSTAEAHAQRETLADISFWQSEITDTREASDCISVRQRFTWFFPSTWLRNRRELP